MLRVKVTKTNIGILLRNNATEGVYGEVKRTFGSFNSFYPRVGMVFGVDFLKILNIVMQLTYAQVPFISIYTIDDKENITFEVLAP